MVVTCINDTYDEKAKSFFDIYKVDLPKTGEKYTIRKVVFSKGCYILLLEEITNKEVLISNINHGEPGFHYWRFSNGDPGHVLDWEVIEKIYKNQ